MVRLGEFPTIFNLINSLRWRYIQSTEGNHPRDHTTPHHTTLIMKFLEQLIDALCILAIFPFVRFVEWFEGSPASSKFALLAGLPVFGLFCEIFPFQVFFR